MIFPWATTIQKIVSHEICPKAIVPQAFAPRTMTPELFPLDNYPLDNWELLKTVSTWVVLSPNFSLARQVLQLRALVQGGIVNPFLELWLFSTFIFYISLSHEIKINSFSSFI